MAWSLPRMSACNTPSKAASLGAAGEAPIRINRWPAFRSEKAEAYTHEGGPMPFGQTSGAIRAVHRHELLQRAGRDERPASDLQKVQLPLSEKAIDRGPAQAEKLGGMIDRNEHMKTSPKNAPASPGESLGAVTTFRGQTVLENQAAAAS